LDRRGSASPRRRAEGPAARIMSLRDGSAKMSKSDPSDASRINLLDDEDAIATKIRKARTDPEPLPATIEELADRPEAKNLVGIYAVLAGKTEQQVLDEFGGHGFGKFKPALADLAVAKLGPVADTMRRLMNDPAEVDRVLKAGGERAKATPQRRTTRANNMLRSRASSTSVPGTPCPKPPFLSAIERPRRLKNRCGFREKKLDPASPDFTYTYRSR